MATDAKLALQASVTKTATFNGTGVSLPTGTPQASPMFARIIITDAKTTSGAGTATFRVTYSADNSSWAGISETADTELTLSGTTQTGELFIPLITKKPYVRLELSALTGTGATVTYQGDIVWAAP
jgi:hypothetical protein